MEWLGSNSMDHYLLQQWIKVKDSSATWHLGILDLLECMKLEPPPTDACLSIRRQLLIPEDPCVLLLQFTMAMRKALFHCLGLYFLPVIVINFQGVQTMCFTIMVTFSRKLPDLLILGITYYPDSLEQKVFNLSIPSAPPTLGDAHDRMAGGISSSTVSSLEYQSLMH